MKIITIDGPASSGKGTVAKIIAKKLGYHYLESGAIYRVVGLTAINNGLSLKDVDRILELIDKVKLEFNDNQVLVDGDNVAELLRAEKVGMMASNIAKVAVIRERLMNFQRGFARNPGLVTDGRDMGSVVFPHADLKVFLTASAETRAQRRLQQLQEIDNSVTIQVILRDIQERDKQDSNRSVAPLTFDESFRILDNSHISIDETVTQIIKWAN